MPRPARAWRGRRPRSTPSKLTDPALAGRWPMTVRMRLVLPAPLRPTRLTMLPPATSSEKPRSACTEAMVTWTEEILSTGFPLLASRDVAPHLGIGQHRRRRAVGEHAPAVEGHHAARVARDDVHVVLHEEHRGGLAAER